MTENKNIAEYNHFNKITDKKTLEKIRNIDADSDSLTIEKTLEIAKILNINVTYEELAEFE